MVPWSACEEKNFIKKKKNRFLLTFCYKGLEIIRLLSEVLQLANKYPYVPVSENRKLFLYQRLRIQHCCLKEAWENSEMAFSF